MELWFFYAIIASLFIGINGYLIKLFAEKKIDGAILTFIQGGVYLLVGLIHGLSTGADFTLGGDIGLFFLAIGVIVLYFINVRIRIKALMYLSSSEYFVSYRLFLTGLLALIGVVFLAESLSAHQLFGLLVGSIGILFLFEDDQKLRASRNWSKAIKLLLMSVVAGVGVQIIGKFIGLSTDIYSAVLFYEGIATLVIFSFIDKKEIHHFLVQKKDFLPILFLGIVTALFSYFATVFNLLSYHNGGPISVVTKIMAYSLFIPIILSVIFSGEKVTYKKTIAFFLTIVSLYYMV